MRPFQGLLIGALTALSFVIASVAPSRADLLETIRLNGKIRVAIGLGTPLFGFAGPDKQPTGSDVETARLLAKDLGVDIEFVETSTAARVATIQAGKADILIASLAVTPERLQVIDFSVPYATLDIVVAAPHGTRITDYADLNGKRIGLTRATVNDLLVSLNAPGAEIIRFEDDAALIAASVAGDVDIVSTQPPLIAAMNERRADRPLETKFTMRELNLGIALPKNEPRLKEWLNAWVRTNMANGRLPALFKTFHGRDLPAGLVDRKPTG